VLSCTQQNIPLQGKLLILMLISVECMNLLSSIPAGCRSFDDYLKGGIPSRSVTLVYGEPETGKTTLLMQYAVNCSKKGYKTLYADCDGKFSVRRLSQIASNQFEKLAELIVLMKPATFQEQATAIDQLTDYITNNVGLVVFDTFTSLYRLRIAEYPAKTFEFNRELNRQLAVLAQTARTSKVAVLISSQVHSVLGDVPVGVEPVATRVLKFWADTVLALRPTGDSRVIMLELEKNPFRLSPRSFDLRIEEAGICEH
jgi:DNA repair protein RadB